MLLQQKLPNIPSQTFPPAIKSFETLKLSFTTAPLLQHFNPTLPTTIITDASDFALASILLQPDNNNLLHPVAFHSRKFSSTKINYEIHDKELLSIVDTFGDMRSWLIGSPYPITVISDHKNLEYLCLLVSSTVVKLVGPCFSPNTTSSSTMLLAIRILLTFLLIAPTFHLKRGMTFSSTNINCSFQIPIYIIFFPQLPFIKILFL